MFWLRGRGPYSLGRLGLQQDGCADANLSPQESSIMNMLKPRDPNDYWNAPTYCVKVRGLKYLWGSARLSCVKLLNRSESS